jgi:hypothetical protein
MVFQINTLSIFLGDFMSTFNFQFTEEQTNYILNLAAEKPFKEVHTLITSIQNQAQQQLQTAQQAQQPIQPEVVETKKK